MTHRTCARPASLTRAAVWNAQGKYLEQGYVSTRETQVPYVPFLVAVGA